MVKSEEKGMRFSRRSLLLGASSVALFPRSAGASVARGLGLGELVYQSSHVLLGTATDSFSNWEQIGKRRAIVTYSLFHIEEPLDGRNPPGAEITIRTLGGTVGNLGQRFYGEAVLALDERATVFVHDLAADLYVVTAMAQGHYPVRPDARGTHRLHAEFSAVVITGESEAAMRRLDGRTTPEATDLIAREFDRAR
jgi:hypothetical protein